MTTILNSMSFIFINVSVEEESKPLFKTGKINRCKPMVNMISSRLT